MLEDEYSPQVTVTTANHINGTLADIMIDGPAVENWVRKPRPKAFCIDCKYSNHPDYSDQIYKVGGRRVSILIEKPVDGWLCPHCDHAVTWLSDYEPVN